MKLHLELANGKTAIAEGTENECANFMSLFEKADSFHQTVIDHNKVEISLPDKAEGSKKPRKSGKRGNNSGISDIDGQILSLKSQGLKGPDIAKKLGLTLPQLYNRVFALKKKGKIGHGPKPYKKKPADSDELSDTMKRSIKDLNSIEKSPEQIATALKLPVNRVVKELKALGAMG